MMYCPQPEPVRFAAMIQSWCNLTFLHWRYPVSTIATRVPAPWTVESFDGSAWVGITPFLLRDLRPPILPALPWISKFPETNCRTYVKGPDGRSGVWFFSLDAARAPAVIGARIAYGLPYAWSRMQVGTAPSRIEYQSHRRWPDGSAMTRIEIEPGEPIVATELETFLTARYRLYSYVLGRPSYTNVEHTPWPLYAAQAVRVEQTLTAAAGLPDLEKGPLVHFSSGVTVRVAFPQKLQGAFQHAK